MKSLFSKKNIPLLTTIFVCILLYSAAAIKLDGFFSLQVFVNFLSDNSFLGLAAIGMTFVIIAGGIDLSVGAVVGCVSIMIAQMINQYNIHPVLSFGIALAFGTILGGLMGTIIHYFKQPPFLITLAGMFFARGLGFIINVESQSISHDFYNKVQGFAIPLPGGTTLPAVAIILILMFIFAFGILRYSGFGRNVYAVGGNEQSSLLMGLPVGASKIGVYAFSGLCSSFAGIIYSIYTFSGNPTAGTMLELDAIASVVIGGTLLSGGSGSVIGTFFGILIFGIIQTSIMFEGTLSSWWTKIAIGGLLLAFILLQRIIQKKL